MDAGGSDRYRRMLSRRPHPTGRLRSGWTALAYGPRREPAGNPCRLPGMPVCFCPVQAGRPVRECRCPQAPALAPSGNEAGPWRNRTAAVRPTGCGSRQAHRQGRRGTGLSSAEPGPAAGPSHSIRPVCRAVGCGVSDMAEAPGAVRERRVSRTRWNVSAPVRQGEGSAARRRPGQGLSARPGNPPCGPGRAGRSNGRVVRGAAAL